MKIITLHQPWASLIALKLKRSETRHWATDYMGPLLIHAAKQPMPSPEKLQFPLINLLKEQDPAAFDRLQCAVEQIRAEPNLGCIVAIAHLEGCYRMVDSQVDDPKIRIPSAIYVEAQQPLERSVGLWESGRYAFKLTSVRPLPSPISFTSRQGKLLDAPELLQAMVTNQLEDAA